MHRIDGPGATQDNKFTEGDPANGTQATIVTAEWLNAVQEELARAIESVGVDLVKSNNTQLEEALRRIGGSSVVSIDMSGGTDKVLSDQTSGSGQALRLIGALTANVALIVPDAERRYYVIDETTGGFTVEVRTAAGSGVILSANAHLLRSDGEDVVEDQAATQTTTQPTTQIFTSSGTWNKPTGCKQIAVTVVSGGGAGGGAEATGAGEHSVGSGGGGGGCSTKTIDVSSVSSVAIAVGEGGIASAGAAGGDGGTSSFGAYVSVPGGTGGDVMFAATGSGVTLNVGLGGEGTGGDVNLKGSDGNGSFRDPSTHNHAGNGGASAGIAGGGGRGILTGVGAGSADGHAGGSYGGGGGGAANSQSQAAKSGGPGAGGIVMVKEYY